MTDPALYEAASLGYANVLLQFILDDKHEDVLVSLANAWVKQCDLFPSVPLNIYDGLMQERGWGDDRPE